MLIFFLVYHMIETQVGRQSWKNEGYMSSLCGFGSSSCIMQPTQNKISSSSFDFSKKMKIISMGDFLLTLCPEDELPRSSSERFLTLGH